MRKIAFVLWSLLVSTSLLANTVSQTCWDGKAKIEITLDDVSIVRGQAASPHFHYKIHANPTWSAGWYVWVTLGQCNGGECNQFTSKEVIGGTWGFDLEYDNNLKPPKVLNVRGNYPNSFSIKIPALGCDLTATSITSVL